MRKLNRLLFDIADSARLIHEYIKGMSQEDFRSDSKTQAAVIYRLAIIGEAVKQLPEDWRTQHPSLPWNQMSRMRDHLIHHYFNVDLNTVWDTTQNHVPALTQYLAPLVSPLLAEDESNAS